MFSLPGQEASRRQAWKIKNVTPSAMPQEKRLKRQEEEAKTQRREAARRRTRDLLLERAKQRLIAASKATASCGNSSSGVRVDGVGDEKKSNGLKREAVLLDGGGGGVPPYAQETWAARRSKVRRRNAKLGERGWRHSLCESEGGSPLVL